MTSGGNGQGNSRTAGWKSAGWEGCGSGGPLQRATAVVANGTVLLERSCHLQRHSDVPHELHDLKQAMCQSEPLFPCPYSGGGSRFLATWTVGCARRVVRCCVWGTGSALEELVAWWGRLALPSWDGASCLTGSGGHSGLELSGPFTRLFPVVL